MIKKVLITLVAMTLVSCDKVFDTHPYDVDFNGSRNINYTNIKKIETSCKEKTSLKVAFISDTHGWYSNTKDMLNYLNNIKDLDFVVHLGDLTDCGTTKEYVWARDILNNINVPYVALIGNHDFLGTGDQTFQAMYGDFDFAFIAGRIKFVCVNTNAAEYDHMANIPDFNFMEKHISENHELFDRTIMCMHSRPYCEQFNNNVAKTFQHYVNSYPGLMFCINGHAHRKSKDDIYNDGVIYYGVDSAEHRSFLLFTITANNYECEIIDY